MNRAYDIEEGRTRWKARLGAIGLTIGLALFVLSAYRLGLLGPTIAGWLATQFGFGSVFLMTWQIVQWPLAFALVALAIAIVNYFAPDADQDWEWITPGTVGGAMVLMLWFYVAAFAVLVGAEMNAEIEHASPHGKDKGEKAPGQKRKLGAAAAREYAPRHQSP